MEISRLCIPYTPFTGKLEESKVALVSTAGVYVKDQPPFILDGDTSFRIIPGDVDSQDLRIAHEHYDHSDADKDINCVFPIDRLRELAQEKFIGSVSEIHISMGYTQAFREVREKTIPEIVKQIQNSRADITLMTGG
jgi:D-proline reductase (dithiol) PrdB